MASINIPLTTLIPNQVVLLSSTPVGAFTQAVLSLDRNVGASPIESNGTATLSMFLESSRDNGVNWDFLMGITIGGAVAFADVAQTVPQHTSEIRVRVWPGTTHVRGTVTNGSVSVSVSGVLILS